MRSGVEDEASYSVAFQTPVVVKNQRTISLPQGAAGGRGTMLSALQFVFLSYTMTKKH